MKNIVRYTIRKGKNDDFVGENTNNINEKMKKVIDFEKNTGKEFCRLHINDNLRR